MLVFYLKAKVARHPCRIQFNSVNNAEKEQFVFFRHATVSLDKLSVIIEMIIRFK